MEFYHDFQKYLDEHATNIITIGKSGASVYELDHRYIAKHVRRGLIPSDDVWASYQREAQFYSCCTSECYPFLPVVYHCYYTDDEIQLIMKKYNPIKRTVFDDAMLENVMHVLVQIHAITIPDFLTQRITCPVQLSADEIRRCIGGWCEVICEHGDVFSEKALKRIGEHINAINQQIFTARTMCCHGDFHFDNILSDENGNLIVCDWQSVSCGHASGDLSFFLSRLSADGVTISKERTMQHYCHHSSTDITTKEIKEQMSLANLNTSFIHWHRYLHGCPTERVRNIWEKMIEDAEILYRV